MGLDANGFTRKTYAELLEEEEQMIKELFGEDANTSSQSNLGKLARIHSWKLAEMWEVLERVYQSGFKRFSEGVQLDNHGDNEGVSRNGASQSYAYLDFTGTPGFLIEAETEFTTPDNKHFMLTEDVTLDTDGTGRGLVVSIEFGSDQDVPANTITTMVEPFDEVTSVTNPLPSKGGKDAESDSDYLARMRQNTEGSSGATPNAIISALLNAGARAANVVINRTKEVDADGNPPNSVHAYVLGGTDSEICQALHDSVGGGIETVGAVSYIINDISGVPHIYKFDYVQPLDIYVRVALSTNTEFEETGIVKIKDAIIHHIGGEDSSGTIFTGLKMGQSVIHAQLYFVVGQTNGIEDISITIGVSQDTLTAANIPVSSRQVAQTSLDKIEVIIND